MVVIQSVGQLETMREPWWPKINYGSVKLYDQYNYDYATLYKSQPNVRTCVDFLARNIAQLGLHVFKRVGETDRQRLREHPLALLIAQPLLPEFKVTRYRLIESLVGDLGVYFNAFWLKVRGKDRLQLLRVPPQYMEVSGRLVATKYQIDLGTEKKTLDPNDVVHFRGYNAESAIQGLSPLETLRRILAEEHSAGDYREHFWQNAARQHGIIERPKDAPTWSETARARFKAEFEALYAGGENSGKTAILEEGMTWKAGTFNAQESEYLAGRKLTREECARAYHIPLPMVGILDHATFCLPGHVPVFTAKGPCPIAEVQPGDKVWSHNGTGFALKRVTRSGQTGVDPILRIKTQNRTLEANPTHPILVRRLVKVRGEPDPNADAKTRAGQSRWHYEARHVYVAASEIERGDVLVALKELPEGAPCQSVSRMEFYGLLLGDGNIYPDRGTVSIARANDAPYMDHYREIMREEFKSFGSQGNGKTREGVPTQPVTLVEGDRQTRFASVLATEELTKLGLSGTAHTKRVPEWVFGATGAERLAFLRGYLDADGSVDKRGKISYSSCNRDLIEDIRHLCMSLGIAVNNAYHRVGQTLLPTGEVGDVDQWTITCSDPDANRRIGSHNPRHQRRLAKGKGWDKKGKDYPFAKGRRSEPPIGCAYSRVIEIEKLPAEPIYDIEVEDTHNFVAAGLVVHNSNIKEQHKNLYQDSLGPWLAMIEEEIGLQLLPEFEDRDGVYVEFNIAEKLQGSFEEQVKAYQSSVGAPYMTRNEARARMNLPRVEDPGADQLVIPLNVLVGGQASPRDATPDTRARELTTKDLDVYNADLRQRHEEQWRRVLARHYRRQEAALAGRVSGRDGQTKVDLGGVWYDEERWDSELYADLLPLNASTSLDWAGRTVEALDQEIEQEQLEERVLPWLQEHSRVQAEYMNDYTRDQLAEALRDPEPKDAVKRLFEQAISVWAVREAASAVTTALNFGAVEGAQATGLQFKTWQVNSTNPRDEHAALNGTTVGIRQRFPNGMRWPGDPAGGAENNAYCQCTVRFS